MIVSPPHDCSFCPRLVAYRNANQVANPDWFNGPVPSFGPIDAWLLVVGMAPGLRGANRTGRPFTGDHAGILLYETLLKLGLAAGTYKAEPHDGLALRGVRIANAVRCAPPANLPATTEIATCNQYLQAEVEGLPNVRRILALGLLAHNAVLRSFSVPVSRKKFVHGASHELRGGLILTDSYHVSRYNTSTRRLTTAMFEAVVSAILSTSP